MQEGRGKKKYIRDKGQEEILDIYLRTRLIPSLVLCLAGPGTGKTTTIVRLLLTLKDLGPRAPIRNFVVLTFTKRTRNDILKKIEDEGRADQIKEFQRYVRNFHSLAFSSLFWEDIITDTDLKNKAFELAEMAQLDQRFTGRIMKMIQELKQAIARNTIVETINTYLENNPTLGNIMQECVNWLEQNYFQSKSISYDYALIKFIKNLKQGRNPFKIDLSKIQLLIVDEFQDSNPAQMKIVECILQRNPKMKLLLMGDIDQTIYTWRGTDLIEIDNFIERYKEKNDFRNVKLENTHRLGSKVAKIANSFINYRDGFREFRQKYYGDFYPKPLNVDHDHSPLVIEFQNEYSEVNWVINEISRIVNADIGINYKDITVLLRTFKFSYFFNKFKFENTRLAQLQNVQQIPFTVKSDETHQNLKSVLAWFVYFHHKKHAVLKTLPDEIKIILKHMKPTKTMLKNMVDHNTIAKAHLYKRAWNNQKQEAWAKFFNDFRTVERIVHEKQTFSEAFQSVYELLSSQKRCLQMTPHQIEQFLEYACILESHLDKQKLRCEPIFAVVQQVIQNNIYDKSKEKKAEAKRGRSKKGKEQEKNRKITEFFSKPSQSKIESSKSNIKEETDEMRQSKKEGIAILFEKEYAHETDSVQFQTVYKAKGLEFKVVFICSLNYDYKHEQFEPNAVPRRREDALQNDAQRQHNRTNDYMRHVVKEAEEQRVVYTALTRTSKYCFVTASNKDCMLPRFAITKHPHFQYLKNHCEETLFVPFEKEEDLKFKEAYEEHLAAARPARDQHRKGKSSNVKPHI